MARVGLDSWWAYFILNELIQFRRWYLAFYQSGYECICPDGIFFFCWICRGQARFPPRVSIPWDWPGIIRRAANEAALRIMIFTQTPDCSGSYILALKAYRNTKTKLKLINLLQVWEMHNYHGTKLQPNHNDRDGFPKWHCNKSPRTPYLRAWKSYTKSFLCGAVRQ